MGIACISYVGFEAIQDGDQTSPSWIIVVTAVLSNLIIVALVLDNIETSSIDYMHLFYRKIRRTLRKRNQLLLNITPITNIRKKRKNTTNNK